jgi:PhnB protein
MLNDEFPDMGCRGPRSLGGSPTSLHIYVTDADAVFQQAVAAGATVRMPIENAFWGDRYGRLADPFAHEWAIATRQEELTEEEMKQRAGQCTAST